MSMPERRNSGFRSAPNPLFMARGKTPNSARRSAKKREKSAQGADGLDADESRINDIASASAKTPGDSKSDEATPYGTVRKHRSFTPEDVSFATESRSGVNYTIMYVDDDDDDDDDQEDYYSGTSASERANDESDAPMSVGEASYNGKDVVAEEEVPEAGAVAATTAADDSITATDGTATVHKSPVAAAVVAAQTNTGSISSSADAAAAAEAPTSTSSLPVSPIKITSTSPMPPTPPPPAVSTSASKPSTPNIPILPLVHIERPKTREINPYDDDEPEDLLAPDEDDYHDAHADQIELEFEHTDADEDVAREERYKRAEGANNHHLSSPFCGVPKPATGAKSGGSIMNTPISSPARAAATGDDDKAAERDAGSAVKKTPLANLMAPPRTGTAGVGSAAGTKEKDKTHHRKIVTPDDARESRATALIALASYKARTAQTIVDDIQLVMDDESPNPQKFEEVLIYMPSFISGDVEVIEKLVEVGPHICDQIVQITRMYQTSPMIAERACKVVSLLAMQEDGRRLLLEADAGGMVCTLLMLHEGIVPLAEWGLRAIRNLAMNNNAEALMRIGAIDTVITLMKSHKGISTVIQEACSAVAYLASSKETRDELASAGACHEVAEALITHDHDAQVVDRACLAIMFLVSEHEENCKLMGELGVCEAVVGAFKQHKGNSRVAECASAAIHNLADYGPNRKTMLISGVQRRLNGVLSNIEYEPAARQEAEAAFLRIQSLEFDEEFGPGDDCKCSYCVMS